MCKRIPYLLIVICLFTSSFALANSDSLPVNQYQFLGSHNSYRLSPPEEVKAYWNKFRHFMFYSFVRRPLDYQHSESFEEQLNNYNLRNLEIDIYYDPEGARYAKPKGVEMAKIKNYITDSSLLQPGLKILHNPDVDFNTQFFTFKDALYYLKNWSDKHKNHFPLFLMVEIKEINFMSYLRKKYATSVLKFDQAAMQTIDLEIEEVFGNDARQLFTPDSLRGSYENIKEALKNKPWPTLKAMRGKIIFVFMASESAKENYLLNHYSLKNRYAFLFSDPENPECAFVQIDNPVKHFKRIRNLVAKGYFVRTRSDANTKEARKNKYKKMRRAFSSGAQIISTDYYIPDSRSRQSKKWSNYCVSFPNNKQAKFNPLFHPDQDDVFISE